MRLALEPQYADFAATVARALTEAGGVALARDAQEAPPATYERIQQLLADLGVEDVDASEDAASMAATVELCRHAGRNVLPYPLPEVMASDVADLGVAVIDPEHPFVANLPARTRWQLMDLDGMTYSITGSHRANGALSPLTWRVELEPAGSKDPAVAARWLTLDAAYVCGALERALELTVEHLDVRQQFGRSLKEFQSLKFRTVDMAVAVAGVRELCYYTAWSVGGHRTSAVVDALALRVAVLDAARSVLRSAHQAHGAIGFTDEHDLSVVTSHVQGRIRSPWAYQATLQRLTDAIAIHDFEGLFSKELASTGATHD